MFEEYMRKPASHSPTAAGYACMKCGYALDGLGADDRCPECATPVINSTGEAIPQAVPSGSSDGYRCIQCGYALDGLTAERPCPECGTPVADSMRGMLLVQRSPDYVKTLRRGLSLILNGILLLVLSEIVNVALVAALGAFSATPGAAPSPTAMISISVGIAAAMLAIQVMILYGWWRFTTRDPGDPTPDDAPTARRVVRIAVIANAIFQAITLVTSAASGFLLGSGANPAIALTVAAFAGLASLGNLVAYAMQFFAAMMYVRGLAPRLPSLEVKRLAKTRMIACPIWATVGVLILVGPFIALILYWNLLNMVRKEIRRVIEEQRAAGMAG